MKRLNRITAATLASLLTLTGCTLNRDLTTVNPELITTAEFTKFPSDTVTLNKLEPTATQVTLAWQKAYYSYDAAVQYTIEAYNENTIAIVGQTYSDSINIQNKDINTLLLNYFGAEAGRVTPLSIRVVSSIGALASQFDAISSPAILNIIPYSGDSEPLWVVGGYNGWNHDNDIAIYSEMSNGVYSGWIPLLGDGAPEGSDTEFKFTPEQNWNSDYGSADGNSITSLGAGGANIILPGGILYYVTVDLNTLTGSVDMNSISSIGLIGDATPNGWDTPDTPLSYNQSEKVFMATGVEMVSGTFKFRANDTWGVTEWGDTGVSGELFPMGGGENITFSLPDGTYTVKVDLFKVTPTYEFIAE